MATQAMLIQDTIAGMKRAVARSRESALSSDSEASIDRFTNRGNKLKRKARYVHEGKLNWPNGPEVYKRRIEHAGYYRDVISQNPRRYNENGEELEEDEEDEEADAAAAEANPYNGILLHELLGPLTSAADLPSHPSLSVPYLSLILSDMLQDACKMVQRERNTIRGAKQILTKLRGDETWIPCSLLDSNIDNVIFDTSRVYEEIVRLRPSSTLAKKKHEDRTPLAPQMNHAVKITLDDRALSQGPGDAAGAVTLPREAEENAGTEGVSGPASLPGTINEAEEAPCNTSGTDAGGNVGSTVRRDFEVRCSTTSDMDTSAKAANTTTVPGSVDDGRPDPETMELKGGNTDNGAVNVQQPNAEQPNIDGTLDVRDQGVLVESKEDIVMLGEDKAAVNDDPEPIAHRMTTRAQAQAVSDHATSMRTRSPSAASSSVPSIHPLFLIPDGACPDRDFGLPPEEAEATRRILISYVQKQEEVCRGAEKLYNGLLKVERMKKDVFDSCKAEGHVGEMSDGEDWYDKGKWGLEEDLRKGHDEEEDDAGTQHKKTRGRRA